MKPTTLYLYTLSLLTLYVSAFDDSDSDYDVLRMNLLNNGEDGNETEKAMYNFNARLDTAVDKIEEIFKQELPKRLEAVRAQAREAAQLKLKQATTEMAKALAQEEVLKADSLELTAEQIDRVRRKISAKVFRDYGNFDTLDDGTFFSDMFEIPDDFYHDDEI